LVDITTRRSEDQIKSVLRYGQGAMPSFAKLSSPEMDDLLAYLAHPMRALTNSAAPAKPSDIDHYTAHYRSSFGFMFANSGLPVITPPWTTLTAYDLNKGTIRWQIPLGVVPELAAKGFTNTGAQFPRVDPVVTAGGLIFTGTRDRKVRALDAATGKTLWETEVGAALDGMPAVYSVNGREYVVFCAAAQPSTYTHAVPGHPASQDPIAGSYVAFALPAKSTAP
jgi:quinoprotein glucose dehydrogenase